MKLYHSSNVIVESPDTNHSRNQQEEALGLLRFEKPNIQYCIRTERMLQECLTYIKSEQI